MSCISLVANAALTASFLDTFILVSMLVRQAVRDFFVSGSHFIEREKAHSRPLRPQNDADAAGSRPIHSFHSGSQVWLAERPHSAPF